jgi:DNA invertase Pin-like site-specific DNA recombinase
MRVAVYARVSLDRDGDARTIDRQLESCRQYVENRGHEVVREFVDRNASAYNRKKERPQFERMREGLHSRAFDAVCVWKLDRLARRVTTAFLIAADLQQVGAILMCVEDQVDTSTGMGQAIFGLMVAMAENEAESIGKRVKAVRAQEAARGDPPIGGRRCFGYERGFTGQVPEEVALGRRAASLLLHGSNAPAAVNMLNDAGMLTTEGNPWCVRTLTRWLYSPTIAGLRLHDGKQTGGRWEPIITIQQRDRLLIRAGSKLDHGLRPPQRRWMLAGLVLCGTCGQQMRVLNLEPLSYRCRSTPKSCSGRVQVALQHLHSLVETKLFDFLSTMSLQPVPSDGSPEAFAQQAKGYKRRLEGLHISRFVLNEVTPEEWDIAREQLSERIDTARLAKGVAERERAGNLLPGRRDQLEAWWEQATTVQKRTACVHAFSSIVVSPRSASRYGFDVDRINLKWSPEARGRAINGGRADSGIATRM